MKLKAIERICKKEGHIQLFDDIAEMDVEKPEGYEQGLPRQWLSDGRACYPLDGLPYLDEEAVCTMFDIDEKKKQKMNIGHRTTLLEGLDFTDLHPGDSPLEPIEFQMSVGGDDLYLLKEADGGLLVIKREYIKPFDTWKECECYRRVSPRGMRYVAVIQGCVLRGLICPYQVGETVVETLGAVYNAAGIAMGRETGEEDRQ